VCLELLAALIIGNLYLTGGILTRILLFVLVFFVREALITLRSLYRRMRNVGTGYKIVILW